MYLSRQRFGGKNILVCVLHRSLVMKWLQRHNLTIWHLFRQVCTNVIHNHLESCLKLDCSNNKTQTGHHRFQRSVSNHYIGNAVLETDRFHGKWRGNGCFQHSVSNTGIGNAALETVIFQFGCAWNAEFAKTSFPSHCSQHCVSCLHVKHEQPFWTPLLVWAIRKCNFEHSGARVLWRPVFSKRTRSIRTI